MLWLHVQIFRRWKVEKRHDHSCKKKVVKFSEEFRFLVEDGELKHLHRDSIPWTRVPNE
jgi:hypothetical protein